MSVIVNLASKEDGTLKKFLDNFYEKDSSLDNDVVEWINVFNKPLEAIDMITAVIDNKDIYDISLRVSMDPDLFVDVNQSNIDDIVKFMLFRFYKEDKNLEF